MFRNLIFKLRFSVLISFCVCYLRMQMQTLCRAVEILLTTSCSTSAKFLYRGLTKVFTASPFCDQGHEGRVKRNHLSWTTMNVVTKSWIIVTLTICCKKITNSRQHSEPIEFEELSPQLRPQLRQRSRGNEDNTRFANEGTFAFCLCSFWVSLWTLKSKVRERAFSFS